MRKSAVLLIGLFLWCCVGYGQSHGLQFSSHEVVPEKRTALNLTSGGPVCLSGETEIAFDISFIPHLETYFGYIVRLITTDNQNIDIVYNQKLLNFNFVIGETFSAVFTIDSVKLYNSWNHCSIRFSEKSREVSFYVNNTLVCKKQLTLANATCARIYFGANDFEGFKTIDIPPMRLKDVLITQNKKQLYFYPLTETSGTECKDQVENKIATVKNPVWIRPRHQNWQPLHTLATANTPSIAFDKVKEVLYVVAKDSLYQVSFKNGQLSNAVLSKGRGILPAGNQSVVDPVAGKLYNVYIDEKKVSTYNPAEHNWDQNFSSNSLTEFWQANKFYSAVDSSLYVVAGYGQLQYKNLVQRYSFPGKKWETVQPGGDFFMPRYLAALGTNNATDTAYIIGGYGSKTGDQTINPKYSYEMLAYSVKNNSFKSVYHFKEPDKKFCFANSLVIDPVTSDFYSLIYPIDRFNSSLQLIRGSLHSPGYELVGDSIAYSFHDIESFADLFYCAASKKLVAVTMLSTKAGFTTVKIFTIDFPPNTLAVTTPIEKSKTGSWLYWLLAVFALGIIAYLILNRRKKNIVPVPAKENTNIQDMAPVVTADIAVPLIESSAGEPLHQAATISLFGQFEVINKNGVDITRQFTPLVKELFLLMLIYSLKDGKGISSEQLYELLWSDKSIKDARNNYSVNIVKLKTILEKVGEVHIAKESGKWKMEITDRSILLDYRQLVALMNNKQAQDKNFITTLYNTVNRGSLLKDVQYNWLDDIKSDTSSFVTDSFLHYCSTVNLQQEAEFIIKLANCIFHFDQLHEEALEYKCRSLVSLGRHGMAKDAYLKFAKEYRENYGQDFERSFTDLVGHI